MHSMICLGKVLQLPGCSAHLTRAGLRHRYPGRTKCPLAEIINHPVSVMASSLSLEIGAPPGARFSARVYSLSLTKPKVATRYWYYLTHSCKLSYLNAIMTTKQQHHDMVATAR